MGSVLQLELDHEVGRRNVKRTVFCLVLFSIFRQTEGGGGHRDNIHFTSKMVRMEK